MILKKVLYILIITLLIQSGTRAQDTTKSQSIQDSTERKLVSDNLKPAGIFISPIFGLSFPIQKLNLNSSSTFNLGIRLEYASIKLYPVIFGVSYQSQNFKGNDNFKTNNLLNDFQTKITSFGVGFDLLLNKFIKANFTMPFFTLEGKYIKVSRIIDPDIELPDIKKTDSVMGVSAGLGFTVFIFDIYGNYVYAKDYSSIGIQVRSHIPLLKF